MACRDFWILAAAASLALGSTQTLAASFDCAKAATRVEKMVCADAALSDFDDVMARYYQGAAAALKENASCLATDQRDWLRHRRDECGDGGCLGGAYRERLAELAALQPGINTQRRLALPPRAALAWAIAPDAMALQAPRVDSRPVRVEGRILPGDDGTYVLRDASGRSHLLMIDLMLYGATADMLPSLARETGARLVVRGHLATNERGEAYFDHRHCIFIYRLP